MSRRLRPPAPERPYAVGYGKPPADSRFRPGQSGNPTGRPKGARKQPPAASPSVSRLTQIILAEAYRGVPIVEGEKRLTIPVAQAVIRSVAVNAAKGQARAQRLFTQMVGEIERADAERYREWLQAAIEYKVDWEQELERRARLNIDAPAPLPHPDDIHIDFRADTVEVRGPMSKEEKAKYDRILAWRDDQQEEFTYLVEQSRRRGKAKAFYRRMAVETQYFYDRIDAVLWPRYRKPLEGRIWLTEDERKHVEELDLKAAKRRAMRSGKRSRKLC